MVHHICFTTTLESQIPPYERPRSSFGHVHLTSVLIFVAILVYLFIIVVARLLHMYVAVKRLSRLLHDRMRKNCRASEEIRNLFYKCSHEKRARTKAYTI